MRWLCHLYLTLKLIFPLCEEQCESLRRAFGLRQKWRSILMTRHNEKDDPLVFKSHSASSSWMLALYWDPLTTDSSQNVFLKPFLTASMCFCCGGKLGKVGGLWRSMQRRLQRWPLLRVRCLANFSCFTIRPHWLCTPVTEGWSGHINIYTNISDSYYFYLYVCVYVCLYVHKPMPAHTCSGKGQRTDFWSQYSV